MKEMKFSAVRSSGTRWKGVLGSPKRKVWNKLYYNVGLIILAAVSMLIIISQKENAGSRTRMKEVFRSIIDIYPTPRLPKEELLVQQYWNYSSHRGYSFQPNVSNWDEQRTKWMDEHPNLRRGEGELPRVLMVTASSPEPCEPSIFSHLLLRAGKNKLDYSRIHNMEFYYSMGNTNPEFSDWWAKLPVIRMLMLKHPELEWIWWLDADAILTDMSFEPPFEEMNHHNLVLAGEDRLLLDWKSLSTSNYIIRNCQWSLDLLDAWASMGTDSMREDSGQFQAEVVVNRPLLFSGDDQSSLVVLLAQDKQNPIDEQKWIPMVKLVNETQYSMSADWRTVVPKLEEVEELNAMVPFVTHFSGCLPSCAANPEFLTKRLNDCKVHLERAFDFADNQVYEQYGFRPRELGSSLELLVKSARYPNEAFDDVEWNGDGKPEEEFKMVPVVTDWDERRKVWMDKNPSTKKDEVLLVSGSTPRPCPWKAGANLLLRGFKNRIDYGRKNGIKVFYNMAVIDKNLTGWWIKLPLVKLLMLSNPGVEWIWWIDSDAVFTDMDFQIPFARYNASGYNLAMYGNDHELYEIKAYNGINTGNVLIRNCQWSLDLLDRWASLGTTRELRVKNEKLLNEYMIRPPGWETDDQSALVYVLIREREKWGSKVCLEGNYVISGDWMYWPTTFLDGMKYDKRDFRPFVTHFAGCRPCSQDALDSCIVGMDRTYNYADNQVLWEYGLRHEHLNSSESDIQKLPPANISSAGGAQLVIENVKTELD